MHDDQFYFEFQEESNRIEGIQGVKHPEVETLAQFVNACDDGGPTIPKLQDYLAIIQPNAQLRNSSMLNVRVGNYLPPRGGPGIEFQLNILLASAADEEGLHLAPYSVHAGYERLHPFTDGNGRTGRALWLWQMIAIGQRRRVEELGFLHTWYYQSLEASRC